MKMTWIFDDLLDACDDAIKILDKGIRTYTKFQKLVNDGSPTPSASREESVIAPNDDIKAKDITPGESPSNQGGNSVKVGHIIDTELDSTGCYVPKQEKLDQK